MKINITCLDYNITEGQKEVMCKYLTSQYEMLEFYRIGATISINFQLKNEESTEVIFTITSINDDIIELLVSKWNGYKGLNNERKKKNIVLELTEKELEIILVALQDNKHQERQNLGIQIENGNKTIKEVLRK